MPASATLQAWIAALRGGPGAAVFASAVVARIGVADHEAVAAADGGGEALVRGAAATHASQGVRVNALGVAPGVPATRIHEIVKARRGIGDPAGLLP